MHFASTKQKNEKELTRGLSSSGLPINLSNFGALSEFSGLPSSASHEMTYEEWRMI